MDKCRVRAKQFVLGRPNGVRERLRHLFGRERVWSHVEEPSSDERASPETAGGAEGGAPNGFVYAAEEKEVMETGLLEVNVSGVSLCLVMAKGVFYAVDNDCPHAHSPLSDGEINGDTLTCPLHGWQFDLKTGHCAVSEQFVLNRYDVRAQSGSIYVALGV